MNYVVAGGKVIGEVVVRDVNVNGKPDIIAIDGEGKLTTLLH